MLSTSWIYLWSWWLDLWGHQLQHLFKFWSSIYLVETWTGSTCWIQERQWNKLQCLCLAGVHRGKPGLWGGYPADASRVWFGGLCENLTQSWTVWVELATMCILCLQMEVGLACHHWNYRVKIVFSECSRQGWDAMKKKVGVKRMSPVVIQWIQQDQIGIHSLDWDMANGCQKLAPEPGEHIVLSQKREFFSSYFPHNYVAITSFRVLVGATLIK